MTLSCRAQAFSVDNLLRPSSTKITRPTPTAITFPASPESVNELPPTFELEKLLFNNRKRAKNNDIISRRGWCHDDDLQKSLQSTNFFTNQNMDSHIFTHQVPRDVFTLKRQIQPNLENTITPFRGGEKCVINSENTDDRDNELIRFSCLANTKHSEEISPLDASRPSKKPRSSKQSAVSTSCFCHGEMIFCHHPGIVSIADVNGSENSIIAELCHADLWTSFHRLGTEMIITKTGRRMFPALKLRITGLYPDKQYIVRLEFVQPDTRKYRYIYHSSRWMVSGSGDTLTTPQSHKAPEGPVSGQAICSQIVSFERLKLTNTDPCRSGQVSLVSMQKFQPQIVIQEVCTMTGSDVSEPEKYVILFPQTSFMAVTAYQNQQITTLKIASNPFAKGFRESGKARIPYESFMATINNFLSRDTALDYLPRMVRSGAWSRAQFFPRDYNLSLDKGCQEIHSTVDQYKPVPEKILKTEAEMYAPDVCHSDISTVTTPSSPVLYAALQKPLTMPLQQRHLHPHDYQLYQHQHRHYQQHLITSTAPRTVQPLLHYFPYNSEHQKLVATPMPERSPGEDSPPNISPQTTIFSIKPPPAHMPFPTTSGYSLKQQAVVSDTALNAYDSSHYNHITHMTTDILPDFQNRRFGKNDVNSTNNSHLSIHSPTEQKCTNGRSRSSHNSSSTFNVTLPARCMTEPSTMAANETCRCVGCKY